MRTHKWKDVYSVRMITKDNLWKLDMQDDIMRSGFINSDRFVICIYYECRYAQFALSSVIELPMIPAYYPKISIPMDN